MTTCFIPSNAMNFLNVEKDRKRLLLHCRQLGQDKTLGLNLSEVTFCDSAGLAFLIEAKRTAKKFNASFSIYGMSDTISALAKFCAVDEILKNT